jgi:hypothetical protein
MRLRSWLRRLDRAGHRPAVLLGAVFVAAIVAVTVVSVVGLLVQPRFTVLELAAQRLAPEGQSTQPPVEEVDRFAPFDRHYTVLFDTPPSGLGSLIDTAERRRWRVMSRSGDRVVTLEREGVRAVITADDGNTRVDTGIADSVRARQRWSRLVALFVGAGWGLWWTWRQIRGQPRLHSVGHRRHQ